MKRPIRGARAQPTRALPLPRGVIFHARVLSAFERASLDAAVERDLTALVRGDLTEMRYDWALDDEQRAALAQDFALRKQFADWMRVVLLATRAVERIEGMTEEDGSPALPCFDLFAALFEEAAFEEAFKQASVLLMIWLDAEKNGSGRGPRGDSAAAPTTAPDAAPATIPSSGSPAPADSPSPILTAVSGAVPSTNMLPPVSPAPSPGASPAAPDAGASA